MAPGVAFAWPPVPAWGAAVAPAAPPWGAAVVAGAPAAGAAVAPAAPPWAVGAVLALLLLPQAASDASRMSATMTRRLMYNCLLPSLTLIASLLSPSIGNPCLRLTMQGTGAKAPRWDYK